jgi:PhzF family phenazine biosynthesis protein
VITRELSPGINRVVFDSRSGELCVDVEGDDLVLDFPSRPADPVDEIPELIDALRAVPTETHSGLGGLMTVFDNEQAIRELAPDFGKLTAMGDCVIATAPGDNVDFVSRFFAPAYGIDEDPVTGSAHCTMTPYWAARLDKTELRARQISKRGGELRCTFAGDRTRIAGRAVLYSRGTIEV